MARMIDADGLIKSFDENNMYLPDVVEKLINDQPTVDAEPVRHGKWIEVGSGFNYHFVCSECGWKDGYPFNDRHKYCPNCGAKMQEE